MLFLRRDPTLLPKHRRNDARRVPTPEATRAESQNQVLLLTPRPTLPSQPDRLLLLPDRSFVWSFDCVMERSRESVPVVQTAVCCHWWRGAGRRGSGRVEKLRRRCAMAWRRRERRRRRWRLSVHHDRLALCRGWTASIAVEGVKRGLGGHL